jgi:hypothetical protein
MHAIGSGLAILFHICLGYHDKVFDFHTTIKLIFVHISQESIGPSEFLLRQYEVGLHCVF